MPEERWSVHLTVTVGKILKGKTFYLSFDLMAENEKSARDQIFRHVQQIIDLATHKSKKPVSCICWGNPVMNKNTDGRDVLDGSRQLTLLDHYSGRRILKVPLSKKVFIRGSGRTNEMLSLKEGDI